MKLYRYAVTVRYSREARHEFIFWRNALSFYARHQPHAWLDVWHHDSDTWERALNIHERG